jgi:hypothetical protein
MTVWCLSRITVRFVDIGTIDQTQNLRKVQMALLNEIRVISFEKPIAVYVRASGNRSRPSSGTGSHGAAYATNWR